jgi:aryl-alcohol dehydrogenase-like predicted oxidoreductase
LIIAPRAPAAIAVRKHATPAQLALAWLLAREPWIMPIPGITRRERAEENIGSIACGPVTRVAS